MCPNRTITVLSALAALILTRWNRQVSGQATATERASILLNAVLFEQLL
jgi:hypothetical protein